MPSDSFEQFLNLGAARSYAQLARKLGVSKRSVTARAAREGWQARLREVEAAAQRRTEERTVEDLAAIDGRHLRLTRAIQGRALEALRSLAMSNAVAAARALDLAVRLERRILGVPDDRDPDEDRERPISVAQLDRILAAARATKAARNELAREAQPVPANGHAPGEPGGN
jgi:hypothetical protein